MATWVKVAATPLPKGISARYRAGRGWPAGDLDEQAPVLVDDDVLRELKADQMLRVEKTSAPSGASGDVEPLHLPVRLAIDPAQAALDKLERLRAENEALKAQGEIAKLEAENARLRGERNRSEIGTSAEVHAESRAKKESKG